jgi:hypothetical protein
MGFNSAFKGLIYLFGCPYFRSLALAAWINHTITPNFAIPPLLPGPKLSREQDSISWDLTIRNLIKIDILEGSTWSIARVKKNYFVVSVFISSYNDELVP